MPEVDPISILESLKAPKNIQGMKQMFRYAEERFGGKKFDVDVLKSTVRK